VQYAYDKINDFEYDLSWASFFKFTWNWIKFVFTTLFKAVGRGVLRAFKSVL
jgi:hypothetical protein